METTLKGEKRIIRDTKGRFMKGSRPNPAGRSVGVRDKANQIKLAFFEAFEKTGGLEGLIEWIKRDRRNRKEFYKAILTILPKDVDVKGEGFNEETKIIIIRPGEKIEDKKDMSGVRERV